MIVGISGKKQSGKNLTAKIWQLLDIYYNSEYHELVNKPFKGDVDFVLKNLKLSSHVLETDYYRTQFEQRSFAHKLKEITSILFGCSIDNFEDNNFKDSAIADEWKVWKVTGYDYEGEIYEELTYSSEEEAIKTFNVLKEWNIDISYDIQDHLLTYRSALQYIGTELFRKQFHPNVWINTLMSEYTDKRGCTKESSERGETPSPILPNWLVTDVRFKNEANAILDKGGFIIRIHRGNVTNYDHSSELDLDDFANFKYTIDNNNSIENLIENVRDIMVMEGLIMKLGEE